MKKFIFSCLSFVLILCLIGLVSQYNFVNVRKTGDVYEVKQGNHWITPETEKIIDNHSEIEIEKSKKIDNDRYLVQRRYKGELSWKIWSLEDFEYIRGNN